MEDKDDSNLCLLREHLTMSNNQEMSNWGEFLQNYAQENELKIEKGHLPVQIDANDQYQGYVYYSLRESSGDWFASFTFDLYRWDRPELRALIGEIFSRCENRRRFVKGSRYSADFWMCRNPITNFDELKQDFNALRRIVQTSLESWRNHMFIPHEIFMPIDGVGNADDFYVKQNARGKSLTQWENFKGIFSELIGGENSSEREEFDRRIEWLSDRYYMVFKNHTWELPDDPFLGIFVRVIDYELRREGCLNVHLVEGANWTFNGNEEFPYVVFDENVLRERGLAKKIARPVLDLIEWSLRDDVTKQSLYYWNEGKDNDLIPKVVFSPTANNHIDFTLILYEYFSHYELKGGESCGLNENAFRALRLVANILTNTDRAAKDECLILAHFNRVIAIRHFIEKSRTMYAAINVGDVKGSAQCYEEILKSEIYSRGNEEDIRELQLCELNMHGKVRIALWDLDAGSSRPMFRDFISRIKKLNHEYFGRWGSGDECTRREIQFKLIDCLPGYLSTSFVVCHTKYPEPRLREWLSTPGNEKSYQQLLEDGEKLSSVNHESCSESWRRDWRIVLKKLLSDSSLVDADQIRGQSFDDWEVRRHSYTGQLYLYYGTNISGAFPVADWRSDLFLNKDEAGERLSFKTDGVCMTGDCYDAHRYEDPTSKSRVYLYRDSVSVVPINCDNDEDYTRKKIIPYGMNGAEGILSEILKAEKEPQKEAVDE